MPWLGGLEVEEEWGWTHEVDITISPAKQMYKLRLKRGNTARSGWQGESSPIHQNASLMIPKFKVVRNMGVLKGTWGLFQPSMVRWQTWKHLPWKKSFLPSVPKRRGHTHHTGPHREAPGSVRRQEKGDEHEHEPFLRFWWERMGETGRANWASLGLGSLNNSSRLWAGKVAPSCPVSGPQVT